MKSLTILLASVALSGAAAAQTTGPAAAPAASAASQVVAGATVYDTAGAEAAKIDSVKDGLVVVSTGTNKVTLPIASFAAGAKGPVVSVTKAQLDAAATQGAAQQKQALTAALVPGAAVKGSGGTPAGTVKSVTGGNVLLTTPSGDALLPMTAFAVVDGGLTIGMTAEELTAAIAAAKPAGG
jgi:hypothetical protein